MKADDVRDDRWAGTLACPVCADRDVQFHSEMSIMMGTHQERTGIYTCAQSHTFLVPLVTFRGARGKGVNSATVSTKELIVRHVAAVEKARSLIHDLQMNIIESFKLRLDTNRQRDAIRIEEIKRVRALAISRVNESRKVAEVSPASVMRAKEVSFLIH